MHLNEFEDLEQLVSLASITEVIGLVDDMFGILLIDAAGHSRNLVSCTRVNLTKH